jgi:hypothetical protein
MVREFFFFAKHLIYVISILHKMIRRERSCVLYASAVVVGGEMSFKRDTFSTCQIGTVIIWCGKGRRGVWCREPS